MDGSDSTWLSDLLYDKAVTFLLLAFLGWLIGMCVSLIRRAVSGTGFVWCPPWWSFMLFGAAFIVAATQVVPAPVLFSNARDVARQNSCYEIAAIALLIGLVRGAIVRFNPFGE